MRNLINRSLRSLEQVRWSRPSFIEGDASFPGAACSAQGHRGLSGIGSWEGRHRLIEVSL